MANSIPSREYIEEIRHLAMAIATDMKVLEGKVASERNRFNGVHELLHDEALERHFMAEFEGFLGELAKQRTHAPLTNSSPGLRAMPTNWRKR